MKLFKFVLEKMLLQKEKHFFLIFILMNKREQKIRQIIREEIVNNLYEQGMIDEALWDGLKGMFGYAGQKVTDATKQGAQNVASKIQTGVQSVASKIQAGVQNATNAINKQANELNLAFKDASLKGDIETLKKKVAEAEMGLKNQEMALMQTKNLIKAYKQQLVKLGGQRGRVVQQRAKGATNTPAAPQANTGATPPPPPTTPKA